MLELRDLVAVQALELLTRRFDVGSVDRVRLPAVAVVGQPDGAGREDGGAPYRHPLEACQFVPIDERRPRRPASRQAPWLTSPSGPVRVSRAAVRRVP